MASLLDQQRAFAAALRGAEVSRDQTGVEPVVNLEVYRRNSEWQFRNALASSFPVVRRRVGGDYFGQLAADYRRQFPSRSGDLQWVGRDFAGFLRKHLEGTDYAWLADLATLEWARELAAIAEGRAVVGAEVLGSFAPEDLEDLVFVFQPALHLGVSDFPVVSVWLANQVENAPPVDQSLGSEAYMVLARNEGVEIARLEPRLLGCLSALRDGATLGEAMSTAGLDEAALLAALQFMFTNGMVCEVYSAKR
jgi:hypothetical protein